MRSLIHWDQQLLRLINSEWHNPFFDFLMPWLRNANMWIPFYFFFVLFAATNYKRTGWWWIAFAAVTVIITNYVSSDLVKENIYRLRPCNDPRYADWLRVLVGYRPRSSSFTSSHAANHFGLAMFLYITLRKQIGKWALLFFVWAGSICYAQVYVGVHYPIDIAGGAFIGIVVGYLTSWLFNRNYGLA